MKTSKLVGKHRGSSFLVVGSAPSLQDTDLNIPDDIITIGCNRILQHPYFVPDYLMLCDRNPYKLDYDEGVFHAHPEVNYLVSTTLYDPKIKCRGFSVLPKPDFPFYPWRVGVRSTDIALTSFDSPLCSFATIAGPMIQAAVIMGAKRVGVVGVDLQVPEKGSSHFYEDGNKEQLKGDETGSIAPNGCMERFLDLKKLLAEHRIDIKNLSPVTDSPFSAVFGNDDFEDWVGNA